MIQPETHTLDAPGAVLHYDVRSNDASTLPVLLFIGSPMGAEGFVTQAGHFTDRTVVTYDPRGAGRSKRTDGASKTAVEEHADDLHRLIDALGAGPVDIFASSGGAVNALALVVLAACEGIKETYLRLGFGPAMAKFIALVSYEGPIPAGFADQPGPDPATFGLPAVDDGSRDDAVLCLNMPWCPGHRHDFDALRAASTRIVVGVGAQSSNALAGRAGIAVAERLGTEPVIFPGGHDGFIGGEYGGMGEPGPFAAALRKVLID